MESDWKRFRQKLTIWRERYVAECNARLVRILGDTQKTETQRFWDAKEFIAEVAKTLHACLDDLSRSTMWIRLAQMRAAGIITREDLADFSEDLQRQVFDDLTPE